MPIQFVSPALQGASFISKFGVPLLQQAGLTAGVTGLVNAASRAPGQSGVPNVNRRANVGSNNYSGVIGAIPPRDQTGESFRDAELRLSAAARAAGGPSAGGGIGGGNAASFIPYISNSGGFNIAGAERNYETEKLRAAQLAEQDQLSKKYRVADLTKAYNTAKGDEKERLGMEIFALTNPSLAKKVKPGQVGYETIQATRQANTPFASALSAIPSPGSTNYQSAFTAPSSDIVSRSFEGASDGGIQTLLGSTPDLSKSAINFSAAPNETKIGGMSIADAFTGPAFNPSQENLSNLQLALLKEAFNKRLK